MAIIKKKESLAELILLTQSVSDGVARETCAMRLMYVQNYKTRLKEKGGMGKTVRHHLLRHLVARILGVDLVAD